MIGLGSFGRDLLCGWAIEGGRGWSVEDRCRCAADRDEEYAGPRGHPGSRLARGCLVGGSTSHYWCSDNGSHPQVCLPGCISLLETTLRSLGGQAKIGSVRCENLPSCVRW